MPLVIHLIPLFPGSRHSARPPTCVRQLSRVPVYVRMCVRGVCQPHTHTAALRNTGL